jgi:hypothetical protein
MATGFKHVDYMAPSSQANSQQNGELLPDLSSSVPKRLIPYSWDGFDGSTYSGQQIKGVVIGSAAIGSGFNPAINVYKYGVTSSTSDSFVTYNDDGFDGTVNPLVTFTASSGTYYAPVVGVRSDNNYPLRSNASPTGAVFYAEFSVDEGGNSNGSKTLGAFSGSPLGFNDFVGLTDTQDYYQFTVSNSRNVTIGLSSLDGNANLTLIASNGSVLGTSTKSSTASESVTRSLRSGTYYVSVTAPEANTSNALTQATNNYNYGAQVTVASNYRLTVSDPLTGMTAPVYRFYNSRSGVHFYTSNTAERDSLTNNPTGGYQFEGAAFKVANAQNDPGQMPLFRFYNTVVGNHFYTASTTERDSIIGNLPQYQYEGTAFYVRGASDNVGTDMYRFYNTQTGAHFYTASAAERDSVIASLPAFTYEGAVFEVAM